MDGHVHAFAFFGGVPQSILDDTDCCLVSTIEPDGTRLRATLFSALLSHYLFRDRYERPGKGRERGMTKVMLKGWSATRAATIWCRSPTFLTGRASTLWLVFTPTLTDENCDHCFLSSTSVLNPYPCLLK